MTCAQKSGTRSIFFADYVRHVIRDVREICRRFNFSIGFYWMAYTRGGQACSVEELHMVNVRCLRAAAGATGGREQRAVSSKWVPAGSRSGWQVMRWGGQLQVGTHGHRSGQLPNKLQKLRVAPKPPFGHHWPQYGGKFCQGSSRIYQLCNIQRCASNSPDFRAQQCAEYNSKPFRGWYYKWKPYTKVEEEDRCKLYCTAEDFDFFFAMSNRVKDGTPCSPYTDDVCIDGICERVGCDHRLGSKAALDACGVCKGDNSTCLFFSGHYLTQHKANDYYPIVTVPAGTHSIEIQELQTSSSYLAVRNLNMKYYLTKDWMIDWPGKFYFAGTMFDYQRSFNHPERLSSAGPTNETLVFEILLQGKNPGIAWQYTFSKMNNENKIFTKRHSYSWVTVQSDCSVSCGGGESPAQKCWSFTNVLFHFLFARTLPGPGSPG
ncbi:A disintegrin and metalloproteinase with thrombospondin motifs 18 [Varanus komodoensis]|nr:A disintegrin and metalloproteinase with thrombospondin motifs 18 [Varanus komodoensis]